MADSAAAYQALQGFKPRSAEDTISQAENKYDIKGYSDRLSGMRGLIGNLQSSVEAVDPSVTGRTAGTFTTEGQRSALVSRERQPILGQLSKQQEALGTEQQGFNTAQGLASQLATAMFGQDKQQYQQLLDQYNAAIEAEKIAEQKRQYEQQIAMEIRKLEQQNSQFEKQLAESRRAASRGTGYGVSSGGGSTASGPKMSQRSGGGFNFTDGGGSSISAAKYSQLTGIPIGSLLQQMGASGDKYAAQVYNQIRLDPWADQNMGKYKSLYSPIFWGS